MKKLTALGRLFAFCFLPFWAFAQSSPLLDDEPTRQILDRLEIRSGDSKAWPMHSEIRPFSRRNVARAAILMDSTTRFVLTKKEKEGLDFLFADNSEWLAAGELPKTLAEKKSTQLADNEAVSARQRLLRRPFLGVFYRSPAHFYELNTRHFRLKADPVLDFSMGKQDNLGGLLFFNRRGIDVRGDVDERLFFWTSIYETQTRLPDFVNQSVQKNTAIPGGALFKNFRSRIFDVENAYDYLIANAGIGFYATKHIGVQLGHGTNFIGNGYRSMLLSDWAAPYFFLKLNTEVWRIHYQNLFAELTEYGIATNQLAPRKYLASHYLGFNLTQKLSVGLFEAVILNRSNHFELQYLNPVILYRTVEGAIGSPDNVLLGLNAKWNLGRRAQLYGQLMLDEFLFSFAVLPKEGEKQWWGNKQGAQLGLKMPRFLGIDALDAQAEMNVARPYLYSHFDSTKSNYAHLNQPLAHPSGANFREFLAILRWKPAKKIAVEGRIFHIRTGEDAAAGENFGQNILLTNNSRPSEFGNAMFQGADSKIRIASLEARYRLFHNAFLEFRASARQKKSENSALDRRDIWISAGLRMNVAARRWEF